MDRHRPIAVWGGLTLSAGLASYLGVVRPWYLRWGATDAEVRRPLPGDELIPCPRMHATRAITIAASPIAIWPWLVQMGQGRGGWYSYTWAENLIGCQITNAEQIEPDLQHLAIGDRLRLGPEGCPFYTVMDI